jgi:hypothetical protein
MHFVMVVVGGDAFVQVVDNKMWPHTFCGLQCSYFQDGAIKGRSEDRRKVGTVLYYFWYSIASKARRQRRAISVNLFGFSISEGFRIAHVHSRAL